MFFKRLELKEKIWCDIVAQAKVVRANYGHQLQDLKIKNPASEAGSFEALLSLPC